MEITTTGLRTCPSTRRTRAGRLFGLSAFLFLVGALVAVADSGDWTWDLPPGFPAPRVPADNPMSEAKVRLGRILFYDTRLSADGSMSCATCHRPELAFTDGRARPVGVTGEVHPRSAMSLANVAYNVSLTWDAPHERDLEGQLTTPIFGHDPVEMGMERSEDLLARLRSDWLTVLEFQAAFGGSEDGSSDTVSMERVAQALAAFQRTLISGGSAFDRYMYGDEADALDESERRGMRLFFSRRLGCSDCHAGFNFSGPVQFEGSRDHEPLFHNTGLYNLSRTREGLGGYPEDNRGLFRHTLKPEDMGRFKAPTLRNIAVTAPYMHDGSVPTLDAVLDHYASGGRTIDSGPLAGVGSENPFKSERMSGFELGPAERRDLIAFLHALTDPSFLQDPRFGPPEGAATGSSGLDP